MADPATLRTEVTAHLAAAETNANDSAFVDLALARTLASRCLALLDTWPTLPEPHQRLVQAACRYFANSGDDEHDFDSPIGFDDDAEVLNHVAHTLDRDDLAV